MNIVQRNMMLGLQRYARAVSVITAEHDGMRLAMTATAVSEVSLDPPTILVCVNSSAAISDLLHAGDTFTVNILSTGQQDVATACAGRLRGEERFSVGTWLRHPAGNWYLQGAQASFLCRHSQRTAVGSHVVFIGEVHEVLVSDDISPLVYLNRAYIDLPAPQAAARPAPRQQASDP